MIWMILFLVFGLPLTMYLYCGLSHLLIRRDPSFFDWKFMKLILTQPRGGDAVLLWLVPLLMILLFPLFFVLFAWAILRAIFETFAKDKKLGWWSEFYRQELLEANEKIKAKDDEIVRLKEKLQEVR